MTQSGDEVAAAVSWNEKMMVLLAMAGPLFFYVEQEPFLLITGYTFPPTLFGAVLAFLAAGVFGVLALWAVHVTNSMEEGT